MKKLPALILPLIGAGFTSMRWPFCIPPRCCKRR
jgi:hypothetical protein